MPKNKIAVVIPAYNEEENIEDLIDKLFKKGFSKKEIIVVDDGSIDKTYTMARKKGVWVLKNEKNEGKGYSQRKGFFFAKELGFEYVVTMDADGQHLVDDIDKFLKNTSYDIVIGRRKIDPKVMPFKRVISNVLTSFVVSVLCGRRIKDSQCGYRMLNLSRILKIPVKTKKYEAESELLVKACRAGFSLKEVPIRTMYSVGGSHISPFVDTLRFIVLSVKLIFV